MLILVGCLGAFVLVLLILIIVCLVKKKNKPQSQAENSPEARERMIESSQQQQRFNPNNTSPTEYYWSNQHPKMGQPLPPTPLEKNLAHQSPLESRHHHYRHHRR